MNATPKKRPAEDNFVPVTVSNPSIVNTGIDQRMMEVANQPAEKRARLQRGGLRSCAKVILLINFQYDSSLWTRAFFMTIIYYIFFGFHYDVPLNSICSKAENNYSSLRVCFVKNFKFAYNILCVFL